MRFENTSIMNFQGAFRGLRNPLESWSRSDSFFGTYSLSEDNYKLDDVITAWVDNELTHTELNSAGKTIIEEGSEEWDALWDSYWDWFYNDAHGILEQGEDYVIVAAIGPNDMNLAQRMIRAGASDRKFLRQIMVSVDITAPLYWWKEFDTYKIGTTANSTSTMHKLASTPITLENFEIEDYEPDLRLIDDIDMGIRIRSFIDDLEQLRQMYLETKDKRYWKELVRWLPNGWLQTRTVTLNYEVLRNIYAQRRYHKLTEWHRFCDWVKSLPYGQELITYNIDK